MTALQAHAPHRRSRQRPHEPLRITYTSWVAFQPSNTPPDPYAPHAASSNAAYLEHRVSQCSRNRRGERDEGSGVDSCTALPLSFSLVFEGKWRDWKLFFTSLRRQASGSTLEMGWGCSCCGSSYF